MKKTIATLIAGLFATAAFAQAPAPKQAVLVNNADVKATKTETKAVPAEAKAAQADVKEAHADAKAAKTHAKEAKASAKHAKAKTKHVVKEDTAATTAPAPAPADAYPGRSGLFGCHGQLGYLGHVGRIGYPGCSCHAGYPGYPGTGSCTRRSGHPVTLQPSSRSPRDAGFFHVAASSACEFGVRVHFQSMSRC
jgi:hypothetical protein